MNEMTSRQRVINAIEHKQVDRMPIDLGLHLSTGISAFAYYNLREYLGLSTNNVKINDPMQFLAKVDEDVLERFHCDCYHLHPGYNNPSIFKPYEKYKFITEERLMPKLNENDEWVVTQGEKQARMPKGCFFYEDNGKGWIEPYDYVDEMTINRLALEAERIYKETKYFTMFMGWGAFFGDLKFQMDMLLNPDEIYAINDKRLTEQIKNTQRIIDKMGDYVQCIGINSDLGTQKGPMSSPELHKEMIAPYIQKYCEYVHQNSDMKIFMHSCGSIEPFIPIMIEAGVDILNPIQISANNMEPEVLKEKFGKSIAFWGGGCDTQRVLGFKTPEEVQENVRQLIKAFNSDKTGFIFNQVHNIMGDVSPDNIVAMLDEAYANSK